MQEPFPTTFHIKIVCGKALQPPGELRFILVAVFIKIAAQPDSTTIVKGQTLPLSTWVGAFLLQLYLGNGDYDGQILYMMDFKPKTQVKLWILYI